MTEYFRRLIIKLLLNKQLINATLATNLINWKHSGFFIDHSIRIPAFSNKAREALSQYIARPRIAPKEAYLSAAHPSDPSRLSLFRAPGLVWGWFG